MKGFLLGLASGTTCLAFCAPVLVPYLLDDGKNVWQNLLTLLQFLGGRLGGYALFGLSAWAAGSLLSSATGHFQSTMMGIVYIGLASLLLLSTLRNRATATGPCALRSIQARLERWPALLAVGMGFLAGLKVCPPLLLAFADAASMASLADSLVFFLAFFVGTSIYFVPLSLVGAFRHVSALRTIGRFAAVIVALYYTYSGVLLVIGGMSIWLR